jgi:hypothetical protein
MDVSAWCFFALGSGVLGAWIAAAVAPADGPIGAGAGLGVAAVTFAWTAVRGRARARRAFGRIAAPVEGGRRRTV